MATISGIHHITAISGPAQASVDFYVGVLGMRLVKKTVNFDDPGTYHLYFGDAAGRPGSLLTFFPWTGAFKGRAGLGAAQTTAFSVAAGALPRWRERLTAAGVDVRDAERFGEPVLQFDDPDGLHLELVGVTSGPEDELAVEAFHSAALRVADTERTAQLLTGTFGYELVGEEDGRLRLRAPGEAPAAVVDLIGGPGERVRMGIGTVHHVAFRTADDDEQQQWRARLQDHGLQVTPVQDRQYFHSIYFREPGGVLFEIATDPPGFTLDEPADALGTSLKLPPWLEPQRELIERRLPNLHVPAPGSAASE